MRLLLDLIISPEFIYSLLRISTPLIFGTLAAHIASKAGLVNMAVEGMMLMAAVLGVIFSAWLGGPYLAFLLVIAMGAFMGSCSASYLRCWIPKSCCAVSPSTY